MAREDIITMTQEELKRLHVVKKVLAKELKQIEAADKLGLSARQISRITKRVKEEGEKGIVHKSRGQISHNKTPDKVKNKVINIFKNKYKDFGPTLASEMFFENEKITLSDETLRNWLIKEGLWQRRRKRKKNRRWREPKHYYGEMIQWDGSEHDWFEGRGRKCVLMGQIDDATGKKSGQFYNYEGTMPSFASLKQYIGTHGIPHSIYLDRHSTYKSPKKPTIEDQLNNREFLSQFDRAAKELGIRIIYANSPQAKGRVERSFRTDQDRLIKQMRLAKVKTKKEANKFLKSYWLKHNKKFSRKPLKKSNMHRPVPEGLDLDAILCKKTEHSLRNDFTIVRNKKLYQILDKGLGKQITVEERINGKLCVTYKGRRLKYKAITTRLKKAKQKPKSKKIIRPSPDHPWRNDSYKKMLEKKARLENKKAKEELVLLKT